MSLALQLAARGLFTTDPNPRVGCVLVADGKVVGQGWHRRAGEAHAEILALAEASDRARGATAYVTLEPCSHHGRTPPCAQALISAGISEVVVAMADPNPAVGGEGLERLTRAGLTVRSGLMERQARDLNPGFIKRHQTGLPWVRVKLAVSLDGRTAAADGSSKWITGPAARENVQRWRGRASAILTGIGTVLADDPRLNVRLDGYERQPLRVVVDSSFRMPADAAMLALPGPVLVAGCREVRAIGDAEILELPPAADGRVELEALLEALAARDINEVHVEAGPRLSGAFLAAGLVDELLVYQAPCLLGDRGEPLAELPGMENMDQRLHLLPLEDRIVGGDRLMRFGFPEDD